MKAKVQDFLSCYCDEKKLPEHYGAVSIESRPPSHRPDWLPPRREVKATDRGTDARKGGPQQC
jgi:hypothetical protein